MKKFFQIVAVCFSGCLILAGCNNGSNSSTVENSGPQRDTVIIKLMAFTPDTLTVNKGDTVVWINQDIVAHDVSHFPDRAWHSDTLNPQNVFVKVIDDSSSYFCSIHPTMRATVLLKK
ncbi:MAG: plastocyanin/azurin family copper-binding protein [Chitinophagaceae bacterium]|nr:plastocyanin/azurin family copper-binding protein [Chitinophagaceae bacterium]